MEQLLHRGSVTGLAAVLAGAGLIAVAPVTPLPSLPPLHVDVQLIADPITETINAVWDSAQTAANDIFGPSGAVQDFFNLDLDGALWALHSSFVEVVSMPQNLLIGGLATLLDDSTFFYLHNDLHGLITADPLTDLWSDFGSAFANIEVAVGDLFRFDLVDALYHSFAALNSVFLEVPATLTAGMTEYIWSDLLGMP